jgi:hypothetical protein
MSPLPEDPHGVPSDFELQIDGAHCDWLMNASGGAIRADMIVEPGDENHYLHKAIGSPLYESIVLDLGFPMDKKIRNWIARSWMLQSPRLDGSILACGGNSGHHALSLRKFSDALMEETTIPTLDVDTASTGEIRVKLLPERLELQRRPKVEAPPPGAGGTTPLVLSNFRLEMSGLNGEYVNRIESFTVHQAVHRHSIGERPGTYELEAGKVEFPNLKITLADNPQADGWCEWFKSFVIDGRSDRDQFKKGKISLLSPDLRKEIAHIMLIDVGICRIGDTNTVRGQSVHMLDAELYCERMEFG